MKTIKLMYAILMVAFVMMSCSASTQESQSSEVQSEVSADQTPQSTALNDYMTLKDALVQSDVAAAKMAAEALSKSLEKEEMETTMIEASKLISGSNDLKEQRTAFKTVTDGLIASLKANSESEGVFVQFCPMAFDNTGANWLSTSNEIRNPYFGDMMLKCGRVVEEL